MSKTIVMVISSLDAGGAERVLSVLGNYFFNKKYDVKILTYDSPGGRIFYFINEEIEIVPLSLKNRSGNLFSAIVNNIRRIFVLRRAIIKERPDVVMSYMVDTSIITLIAMLFRKTPVIVSEHSDPEGLHVKKVWQYLRVKIYNLASLVVVLNRTTQQWFEERVKSKVVVIPNPIVALPIENIDSNINTIKTIIAVGRLVSTKAYDVLLPAFALAHKSHPGWRLKIFGDGPEKETLLQLRNDLGVSAHVEFCGVVADIYSEYRKAEFFVMSSKTEAFPMALCEAMSSQLCVITTRFHQSISDLVIDGTNGLLADVEDVEGLAETMKRAMDSEKLRHSLGCAARESMKEYSVENVVNKWEEQFRALQIIE